jgi:competence ComEA-like helix-hairpin-helix protein
VPTPNERKALWFLAFVAISGSGVRLWRSTAQSAHANQDAALSRQIVRVDSARAAGVRRRSQRREVVQATGPTTPIDVDRASAEEIERLPGIGPALAQRIVTNRDSLGTFGALDALCDVRGVGPALTKRLRPLVTFTGAPRPLSGACGEASNESRKTRAARPRELR